MRSANTADDVSDSGGSTGPAEVSPRPDEKSSGSRLAAGTFVYDPDSERLTWSDSLFQVFGFEVGQIVPTLSLMARHQDPASGQDWAAAMAAAIDDGRPSTLWHRILTVRNRSRTLVTRIEPTLADGRVIAVSGTCTDLSDRLRQEFADELTAAIDRSSQTRGMIERAKGVLMGTMDVDEQQAFDVLRWHSSFTNTKLREVCATLINQLSEPTHAHLPPRQRVNAVLSGLGNPRPEPVSVRTAPWTEQPTVRDQRDGGADSRIPADQLAATLVRAVAAAGVSIAIVDCSQPDWPLVYVNPAFERLTGYQQGQILGRNCRFLQGEETDPAQTAAIRRALDAGEEVRTILRNYRQDGTPFWNELSLSAVRDAGGVLTHYIGYQHDVSEREERERQLEHLAYHDPDTGLPNQKAALRHLAAHLAENGDTEIGAFIVRLAADPGGSAGSSDFAAGNGGLSASGADGATPTDEGGFDGQGGNRSGPMRQLSAGLRDGATGPVYLAQLEPDAILVVSPEPGDVVEARIHSALRTVAAGGGLRAQVGHARYPEHAADPHELLAAARRRSRQFDHSADHSADPSQDPGNGAR